MDFDSYNPFFFGLATKIKKIVVRKIAKDAKETAAVKDGVLTVQTNASTRRFPCRNSSEGHAYLIMGDRCRRAS